MTEPAKTSATDVPLPLLQRLEAVVAARLEQQPGNSYVAYLAKQGDHAIAAKLVEETYELIEAGGQEDPERHLAVVHEAADLLFHLLVFLGMQQVPLRDIERELQNRFGVSGLAEKAARTEPTP